MEYHVAWCMRCERQLQVVGTDETSHIYCSFACRQNDTRPISPPPELSGSPSSTSAPNSPLVKQPSFSSLAETTPDLRELKPTRSKSREKDLHYPALLNRSPRLRPNTGVLPSPELTPNAYDLDLAKVGNEPELRLPESEMSLQEAEKAVGAGKTDVQQLGSK